MIHRRTSRPAPPASGTSRKAHGAPTYDRNRDLPRLLPLWPSELADVGPEGRQRLIRLLRRALRAERRRGIARHWTYDLARHSQLRAALTAEIEAARQAEETAARRRPRQSCGVTPAK